MKRQQETVHDDRRGFTLLELVAVSLLLGLIAGVFAVGFRTSFDQADERQAVELVLLYDQQCRTLAERTGNSVELRFDENQKTLARRVDGASSPQVLGTDVKIASLKSLVSERSNVVFYGSEGQSESYVIRGARSMTLVLGKTGQHLLVEDLKEAKQLVDAES